MTPIMIHHRHHIHPMWIIIVKNHIIGITLNIIIETKMGIIIVNRETHADQVTEHLEAVLEVVNEIAVITIVIMNIILDLVENIMTDMMTIVVEKVGTIISSNNSLINQRRKKKLRTIR